MNYKKMPSGYGMILLSVMSDDTLTIESKAIYSLLCAYTGTKNYCFPKVETMCNSLNISVKRFYKHMNILTERGLVVKSKLFSDLRNNNKYEVMYPESTKREDESSQNIQPEPSQNDHVHISQNVPIINNNSNNNNSNNSNSNNNTSKESKDFSQWFYDTMTKPTRYLNKPPNLNNWSKDADKLHTIDGLSWDKIYHVAKWSLKDNFWSGNILSPAKLRKQFDRLETACNKSSPVNQEDKLKAFKRAVGGMNK